MALRFSTQPGRRERHLRRRHQNPLFGSPAPEVSRTELDRARYNDRQESEKFEGEFADLVKQAAGLQPNEDSAVILGLKERLDQAYEQASGLGGDHTPQKTAIRHLVALIMAAVRRGAGNDAKALAELEQEEAARTLHYQLLEQPLVADLLVKDSPIETDQLCPALLSGNAAELEAALQLFDPEQLAALEHDADRMLQDLDEGAVTPSIFTRLAQIRQRVAGSPVTPHH